MPVLAFNYGDKRLSAHIDVDSTARNCGYYEVGLSSFNGGWESMKPIDQTRALRFVADYLTKNYLWNDRALIFSASTDGHQQMFRKFLTKTKRFKLIGRPTGNHVGLEGADDENDYEDYTGEVKSHYNTVIIR